MKKIMMLMLSFVVAIVMLPCFNVLAESDYSITVADGVEDRVTINVAEGANEDDTVEFTVAPEYGYRISRVYYDDGSVHDLSENEGVYSFVMPACDVEVGVEYSEYGFSVFSLDYSDLDIAPYNGADADDVYEYISTKDEWINGGDFSTIFVVYVNTEDEELMVIPKYEVNYFYLDFDLVDEYIAHGTVFYVAGDVSYPDKYISDVGLKDHVAMFSYDDENEVYSEVGSNVVVDGAHYSVVSSFIDDEYSIIENLVLRPDEGYSFLACVRRVAGINQQVNSYVVNDEVLDWIESSYPDYSDDVELGDLFVCWLLYGHDYSLVEVDESVQLMVPDCDDSSAAYAWLMDQEEWRSLDNDGAVAIFDYTFGSAAYLLRRGTCYTNEDYLSNVFDLADKEDMKVYVIGDVNNENTGISTIEFTSAPLKYRNGELMGDVGVEDGAHYQVVDILISDYLDTEANVLLRPDSGYAFNSLLDIEGVSAGYRYINTEFALEQAESVLGFDDIQIGDVIVYWEVEYDARYTKVTADTTDFLFDSVYMYYWEQLLGDLDFWVEAEAGEVAIVELDFDDKLIVATKADNNYGYSIEYMTFEEVMADLDNKDYYIQGDISEDPNVVRRLKFDSLPRHFDDDGFVEDFVISAGEKYELIEYAYDEDYYDEDSAYRVYSAILRPVSPYYFSKFTVSDADLNWIDLMVSEKYIDESGDQYGFSGDLEVGDLVVSWASYDSSNNFNRVYSSKADITLDNKFKDDDYYNVNDLMQDREEWKNAEADEVVVLFHVDDDDYYYGIIKSEDGYNGFCSDDIDKYFSGRAVYVIGTVENDVYVDVEADDENVNPIYGTESSLKYELNIDGLDSQPDSYDVAFYSDVTCKHSSDKFTASYDSSTKTLTVTTKETAIPGNYYFVVTGNDIDSAAIKFTVNKRSLTIEGTEVSAKTYDGTTEATITCGELGNIVNNDIVSVSASGEFATKNAGSAVDVDVSYTISDSHASYYNAPGDETLQASISKKALFVTGTSVDDKTYDGTTEADVTMGTVDGIVEDDDVKVDVSASYADKNVGASKNVSITYSLSGDDKDNYEVPSDTSSEADISAKELLVTPAFLDSKVYDAQTAISASISNIEGIIDGDDVSVEIDSAIIDSADAGERTITITYTISGDDASNYSAEDYEDDYTVTACPINVVADDQFSVTGSDLVELTYTADDLCGDDVFSGALSCDVDKDVNGKYDILQGTLTAGDNYSITFTKGTYEVNEKRSVDVSFEEDAVTRKYGDDNFTLSATSKRDITYSSSDPAVASINETSGEVTILKAGSTTITAATEEDADYFAGSASYTLTVDKRNITLTSDSASKTYDGDSLTKNGITVTGDGFVGSDCLDDDVTECYGVIFEVGCASNTFTYAIKDGNEGNNYNVTVVYGTLTINESKDSPAKVEKDSLNKVLAELQKNYPEENYTGILFKAELNNINSDDYQEIKRNNPGSTIKLLNVSITLGKDDEFGDPEESFDCGTDLISFTFDFDFRNKKDIIICRMHNGQYSQLTVAPNEDGEYVEFNKKNNTITVHASKFSTYAVAYFEDHHKVVNTAVKGNNLIPLLSLVLLSTVINSKKRKH